MQLCQLGLLVSEGLAARGMHEATGVVRLILKEERRK